jgi:hypothetical protein
MQRQCEDATRSLTLAVVASSPGPLLLLDGGLNIVGASTSFARDFALENASVTDHQLGSLGAGEWGVPQLLGLLAATASGAGRIEAFEMDLWRPGQATRHLVIDAERLVYRDLGHRRLVMAVRDVTEARNSVGMREDTLRRDLVFLQQARHPVANSLQIIASALKANANVTHCGDTAGELSRVHRCIELITPLVRDLVESKNGAETASIGFQSEPQTAASDHPLFWGPEQEQKSAQNTANPNFSERPHLHRGGKPDHGQNSNLQVFSMFRFLSVIALGGVAATVLGAWSGGFALVDPALNARMVNSSTQAYAGGKDVGAAFDHFRQAWIAASAPPKTVKPKVAPLKIELK